MARAVHRALETGQLGPVLAWVQPPDEAEVKAAYGKTLAARNLGPAAREVADRWFLETVVRLHRAGEGAPYTGVKPAGQVDPLVAATDRAIEHGTGPDLVRLLTETVRDGLQRRLARLKALPAPAENVTAGRQWVAAYVDLVHYVEGLHRLAAGGNAARGPNPPAEGHGAHGAEGGHTPDSAHAAPSHQEPHANDGHD